LCGENVTANKNSKTVTAAQYRALAEFRYHIRAYLEFSDHAAKQAGLEPKQYQLLLALKGLPEDVQPTVGELANQLRTRHHSTVELADRAERNGLVQRARNGAYVCLELTKKGERMLASAVDARLSEARKAGPQLVKTLQELISSESGSSSRKKA
jgi:DNA-binding MarR family transcriptional regulator